MSGYAAGDYRVDDEIPISSKAYKLLSEEKSPIQVSIALNLKTSEVQILYKEYWELRRMHSLVRTYDEVGDKRILGLLRLHRSRKLQYISNEQVIECLRIYGNDLPLIKHRYDEVEVRLRCLDWNTL